MACVSDDWEHHVVNPMLQDMHCGDEEYFNAQDVSFKVCFHSKQHFLQEVWTLRQFLEVESSWETEQNLFLHSFQKFATVFSQTFKPNFQTFSTVRSSCRQCWSLEFVPKNFFLPSLTEFSIWNVENHVLPNKHSLQVNKFPSLCGFTLFVLPFRHHWWKSVGKRRREF